MSWDYRLDAPGRYEVELTYACDPSTPGAEIAIGPLRYRIESTGSWAKFVTVKLGALDLPKRGTLTVRPVAKPSNAVMNLRAVTLTPR